MRIRIYLTVMIMLLSIPVVARAIDQDTLDRMTFLLQQFEYTAWDEGIFDDTTLYEGLEQIYSDSKRDGNDILAAKALWAMGVTGIELFAPTLISAIDDEPIAVCYALGNLESTDGVDALIGKLDDEDMQIRDAAVVGLGNIPWTKDLDESKQDAIKALNARFAVEKEAWVKDDINAAIVFIETGVAISPTFADSEPEGMAH